MTQTALPNADTYIAALLSVFGILLSAIIAAGVSYYQARRTFANLKVEVLERYSAALFAKRLEVYPELYCIISELGKLRFNGSVTNGDVADTLVRVNAWDSKNAIYASEATIALLLKVRYTYLDCRNRSADSPLSDEFIEAVFDAALRLEQGLKEELGIYKVTDFNKPELYLGPLHSFRYRGGTEART